MTGQLGNVIKESAQIAIPYVCSHIDELPDYIRKGITAHFVEEFEEVLDITYP